MTPTALLRQRLVLQGLVRSPWRTPADAVAALGAVQAQDFGMAKWALGLRVPDSDEAQIEQAFNAGHILRTHVLRPTWHFVVPSDLRWMLALTAPRIHAAAASHRRQLELDAAVFRRSEKVLARVLAGGRALDRHALEAALREAGVNTASPRLPHLLMHAELEGLLVSGPRERGRFTYMLLDARVPPQKPRDRDAALAGLARRYFQTRAPATVQDFAWWSGLTLRDARAGAAALDRDFTTETLAGARTIVSMNTVRTAAAFDAALLLPAYDEYIVAYAGRDALLARANASARVDRFGVISNPSLILEGRVAGGWRCAVAGNQITMAVAPVPPLTPPQRTALREAAGRYSRFHARPVTVEIAARSSANPRSLSPRARR